MMTARIALCALALAAVAGCSQTTAPATAKLATTKPAVFVTPAPSTRPSASAGFQVTGEFAVGGEGRWDYCISDRDSHRLYMPRSDRVMVLDGVTGNVLGTVPATPGVHGVALAKRLRRGFTSNGADGSVTIFDLDTFAALGKIPAGKNPDAIIYDSVSKRVFAFNGKSQDATVIESAVDPANPVAVGTIPLGGKPEFAVADGAGHVFVNIQDTGEIVRIDAGTLAVTARWSIAPGQEPIGLAMDQKNRRLFAVCRNKLMVVVNADTGNVVTTLPIGSDADAAAFDPELSLVFASGGDGTLTVVHEDTPDQFSVVQTVATRKGARTMALDTKSHRIYLPTAQFGPAPAPTADDPRPQPQMLSGTFTILVVKGTGR